MNAYNNIKLAQSASTLGAALLGFGIGAKWGSTISPFILIMAIILGSVLHIAGMYVVQMRNDSRRDAIARILWITAWICLIALVGIVLFIFLS